MIPARLCALSLCCFLPAAPAAAAKPADWAHHGRIRTRQDRLNLGLSYLVAMDLRRSFLGRGPARDPIGPLLREIWAMPSADPLRQKKLDVVLYILQEDFGVTARNLGSKLRRTPYLLELAEERAKSYLNELTGELCEITRWASLHGEKSKEEAALGLGRLSKFYGDFLTPENQRDAAKLYPLALELHAKELMLRSKSLAGQLDRITGSIDRALSEELEAVPVVVKPRPGWPWRRPGVSPGLLKASMKRFSSLSRRPPPGVGHPEIFAQAFIDRHWADQRGAAASGAVPGVVLPIFLKGLIPINPEAERAVHQGRLKLYFVDNSREGQGVIREHTRLHGETIAVLPVMGRRRRGLEAIHDFKPMIPGLMLEQMLEASLETEPPLAFAQFLVRSRPALLPRIRLPRWRLRLPAGPDWGALVQELKTARFAAGVLLTFWLRSAWAQSMVLPYQNYSIGYIRPYHSALRHETPSPDILSSPHITLIALATLATGVAMNLWMSRRARESEAKPIPRLMSVYWATTLGLLLGLWIGEFLCWTLAL